MKHVDVLVIGAGIHGAGVAQAVAARGNTVLVIDKCQEAGCETSSASSKLIHGGLRYLENAEFRLVYECLRERRLLLKNAPQLVHLQPFYIPLYKNSQRHPLWVGLGLFVYWALSGFDRQNRFRLVGKNAWSKLACSGENLRAVYQYFDGQTDDQALTQAVLRSAESLGAESIFGVEIRSAAIVDGRYQVQMSTGQSVTCTALVNAAGPWVNSVADLVADAPKQSLEWIQGTHIVIAKPAPAGCFYLESPRDGRAVFVLPWKGKTMIGTTERQLSQPRAEASEAEVEYLLEVYNSYFNADLASRTQVDKIFCGTRVLPAEDRVANVRSRETVFAVKQQGACVYLAIYGGKLTSYRATAARIVGRLAPLLGKAAKNAPTTADIALGEPLR